MATLRMCWRDSAGALAMLLLACGCGDPAKTRGVTVRALADDERALAQSCIGSDMNSLDSEHALRRIEVATAGTNPVLVLAGMSGAHSWVELGPGGPTKREERRRAVSPAIDRCVASKDPLIRMAGGSALQQLHEKDRLKRELDRDSSFLLVRPEPEVNILAPMPTGDADKKRRMAAV